MSAVVLSPQPDTANPLVDKSRVLSSAEVVCTVDATGEGELLERTASPSGHGACATRGLAASKLRQLEHELHTLLMRYDEPSNTAARAYLLHAAAVPIDQKQADL